jgi:hypothetical protein
MVLNEQCGNVGALRELTEGLHGVEQSVGIIPGQSYDAAASCRDARDRVALGMCIDDGPAPCERVANDLRTAHTYDDVGSIGHQRQSA